MKMPLDKTVCADARVPFPQGKGTKGCRGPARIPCGAPAPGPPSDKRLVSVEPRRGAPDGVPSGSALTAPLKTFRFQRGPVLRVGRRGGEGRASHVMPFQGTRKASPERGGAREAGGGVPFPPRRKVAAALSAAVTTTNLQETAPNLQRHIVWKKNHLEPQPLFGRGGLGERRFS